MSNQKTASTSSRYAFSCPRSLPRRQSYSYVYTSHTLTHIWYSQSLLPLLLLLLFFFSLLILRQHLVSVWSRSQSLFLTTTIKNWRTAHNCCRVLFFFFALQKGNNILLFTIETRYPKCRLDGLSWYTLRVVVIVAYISLRRYITGIKHIWMLSFSAHCCHNGVLYINKLGHVKKKKKHSNGTSRNAGESKRV
jgi:hypothetical protein